MDEEREDRGFQTAGSLAMGIVSSPDRLASMLKRSLPSSGITGSTSPARLAGASPGRALSATGAELSLQLKGALASLDADKAGSALQALLKPLERSSLQPVLTDDGSRTTDWEVVGYRLIGLIPAPQLDRLTRMVEAMTKPAGRELISKEALRCLSLTKSRERDAADLTLMASAMTDELAEFPADVVATAFRKWARRETWWPSLAEIREPCQREMRWRRSLKIALEDASRIPQGGDSA